MFQSIRKDFPIFEKYPGLVYLDSAATSLKPQAVINAEKEYLEAYSTNVGRGLYPLAETATEKFEAVREKTTRFIGARSAKEIIFTSGTTHSINLAAQLLEQFLFSGHPDPELVEGEGSRSDTTRFLDKLGMTKGNKTPASKPNIVVTELEHHSNFLPWKELATRTGAEFRAAPITPDGIIDGEALLALVDDHTAIITFSAVSNVTGAISPVADIVKRIKIKNPEAIIIIDAAQAIGHLPIDISAWNADFVAFSAHKCFGPTGVGVLYGKAALLERLAPVSFGGGMVLNACAETPVYKDMPYCFEAGTPNIGGVIAFGAALNFIESINLDDIRAHEISLTEYALEKLRETFGGTIRIIGPKDAGNRGGIIAFAVGGVHPHDIAHLLGESGICVRAGEHCTAPLHRALNLNATTRVSFSIYNDEKDIDRLIEELKKVSLVLK